MLYSVGVEEQPRTEGRAGTEGQQRLEGLKKKKKKDWITFIIST